MNSPTAERSGLPYRCPVCRAKLGAETATPTHNAPCRSCGHYLWCRMRIVDDVAVLDILPDRVPSDEDRLADSLAGPGDAPQVILNLSGVDLVGSLFLARLLVLHERIQQDKGRLVLCCLHPLVRDALATAKLDTILEIAEDEVSALASF